MSDVKHIKLGTGAYVVNHGRYWMEVGGVKQAVAALFIEPVEVAGTVGADASNSGFPRNDVARGGIIITFQTPQCAEVLRNEIHEAIQS